MRPAPAMSSRTFHYLASLALTVVAAGCSRAPEPASESPTQPSRAEAPPSSAEVDRRILRAAELVEAGDVAEGLEEARAAFATTRTTGVFASDEAALLRLQSALIPLSPDAADPRLLVGTTLALATSTDLSTARSPLAAWVQRRPASYSPLLALGHLAHAFGHLEPARMWFGRATAVAPRRSEAIVALAILDAAAGDFGQAIARLDGVIGREPDHAAAHLYRGMARSASGDEAGALVDWQRAGELDDGEYGASADSMRGAMLGRQDDLEGALEAFRRAASREPRSATYAYQVGQALHRSGRVDEAVAATRRALELDADDPRPHELLGRIAAEKGDDAEAERHYREALRLAPTHERARTALAELLDRTGRPAEAAALRMPAKEP